jgi:hypothetical protein
MELEQVMQNTFLKEPVRKEPAAYIEVDSVRASGAMDIVVTHGGWIPITHEPEEYDGTVPPWTFYMVAAEYVLENMCETLSGFCEHEGTYYQYNEADFSYITSKELFEQHYVAQDTKMHMEVTTE